MARKFVRSTVVAGCVVCAGLAPIAPALASAQVDNLTDVTQSDNTKDWYPGRPDSMVIGIPGTDDTNFIARSLGIFGNREAYRLEYPESAGPFIAGRSGEFFLLAPSYAESSAIARDNLVEALRQLNEQAPEGGRKSIILAGYSQGDKALYDAAVIAIEKGYLNEDDLIVFVSSPGSPWGLATQADQYPFLPQLAGLVGFTTGVDDPSKLGDVPSEEHVIVGDSVAGSLFNPLNPVGSVAVILAGHLIHSSLTSQSYNNLDELGTPTIYKSVDGKMTVYVYEDVHHPITLAAEFVLSKLSGGAIQLSDEQKNQLDVFNNTWAPITPLTEENAGIKLVKVQQGDLPTYRTSPVPAWSVTVPSAVATGAEAPADASTLTRVDEVPVPADPEFEPVSNPDSSPAPVVVEGPVSPAAQEPVYTVPEEPVVDDSSSQPESPAPATSAVSPQGDMAGGGSDSSATPHDAADDSDSGSDDSSSDASGPSDSDNSDSGTGSGSGSSSE